MTARLGGLRRRSVAILLALGLVVGSAACTDAEPSADGGSDRSTSTALGEPDGAVDDVRPPSGALAELTPIRIDRGAGRTAFVDGSGRQVLLRGANLNSLGDYFQADPAHEPTKPPTDADWDAMAANGFNVVRLVVSWSRLEPVRGQLDQAYVDEIAAAVAAAAARRIYTVVDMHQDAWGKFIATPPGTVCPEGTEPAIGWDGAPEWATITDGASTCRPPGYREGAPAVQAAFRNFYENRDAIRDAFAATWGRLVAALGATPAIAGYDLFNEPNNVLEPAASEQRYTELLRSVIAEVRAAETPAGVLAPRVVFVEPIVTHPLPGSMPAIDLVFDDQLAFAPHNYSEVITNILTVEQTFDLQVSTAGERDWPLWVGEYGVYSVEQDSLDVLRRFAVAQDAAIVGGAQWQWRQWCGDPHSVATVGGAAEGTTVQLNDIVCPGDVDGGPNVELLKVAGRAYPRAAPGRLTELSSDPDTGELLVRGVIEDDLAASGELVVWVPGAARDISGEGIGEPRVTRVPGGAYVSVPVTDSPYELQAR